MSGDPDTDFVGYGTPVEQLSTGKRVLYIYLCWLAINSFLIFNKLNLIAYWKIVAHRTVHLELSIHNISLRYIVICVYSIYINELYPTGCIANCNIYVSYCVVTPQCVTRLANLERQAR